MADIEIWKDIEGYEGIYQVSNLGRVKSLDRTVRTSRGNGLKPVKGKILATVIFPNGYEGVRLYKNNKVKVHLVHRLVAQAFIPNPKHLEEINHISEVKTENFVENLEWCDREYNIHYGTGIERSMNNQQSISVLCISKNGDIIGKYRSIREAARLTKVNKSNISRCCRNLTKYKSAGGYIWRYA